MDQRCLIYWPQSQSLPQQPGFLIGWNTRKFNSVIACIVSGVDLGVLESIINSVSSESSFDGVAKGWSVSLMILGEWCPPLSASPYEPHSNGSGADHDFSARLREDVQLYKDAANLWYRCVPAETDQSRPVISDVYCCGHRFLTNNNEIIFYDYPVPGTFYASAPPSLDPSAFDQAAPDARPADPILDERREMQMVISQINSARSVLAFIDDGIAEQSFGRRAGRERMVLSRTASVPSSAFFAKLLVAIPKLCLHFMMNIMLLFSPFALFLFQLYSDAAKSLLSLQLPSWMFGMPMKLRALSLASLQAEFRICELGSWPSLHKQLDLLQRLPYFVCDASYRAKQIQLYDSVVRAAIDSFLGLVGAFLLFYHADHVLLSLNDLYLFIENNVLRSYVTWFMGEPSGFKLNPELTVWLGEAALSALFYWEMIINVVRACEYAVLLLVCATGFSGASVMIAIACDVFSILTFHVYVLYVCAAFIYKAQLSVMRSFWALFAGKKYNVLRKRVDSHEYDLEQLLLGTLLFCATFFLFPTVAMYYSFFALARLVILSMQFLLNVQVFLLSHFPFYSLYIRMAQSELLPGGVSFEVKVYQPTPAGMEDEAIGARRSTLRTSASVSSLSTIRMPARIRRLTTNYFLLQTIPMPIGALFYRLRQLIGLCVSYYPLSKVWQHVSRGTVVPPPPREQIYSLGHKSGVVSTDFEDLREFVQRFVLEAGPRRLLMKRILSSVSMKLKVKAD
eukprot:ANDGO_02672.mRNA.1 N-acetylglucosaminyl-phosphatidylinositol biosynthetic protein gpi1